MLPHERSLVKRLEGKDFVLLGINSDGSREILKEAIKEERIEWRSWWDGGGTNGPIASRWNVTVWPTVYILDKQGTIRLKKLGAAKAEETDALIDQLLAEPAEPAGSAESSR